MGSLLSFEAQKRTTSFFTGFGFSDFMIERLFGLSELRKSNNTVQITG